MCRKLIYLILFVLVLGLASQANADELLASYENSEMTDLTVLTDAGKDPTLTVTRVLGGVDGAPSATDGDYILKWVWTNETDRKIEIWQEWAVRRLDLAPYNVITADVWFDEPSAQPATIGVYSWDIDAGWPTDAFWAGALSVPEGIDQWHTVEMDIGGIDYDDIRCLAAFLFESLAGNSGVIYTDNMWLRFTLQVQAWRPIPFDKAVSMDPNVDLSWEPGVDVSSHDVYFGTSFAEVNDANNSLPVGTSVYKGNQALGNTSYDPGTLEHLKTYYWRIDEVNNSTIWKGDVWSFKTAPVKYIEIPLVSYEDSETHYDVWASPVIAGEDLSLELGDKLAGGSIWGVGPNSVIVPAASDGDNVLGLKWTNEADLEVEHSYTFTGGFTYDLAGIDEIAFDLYYYNNDSEGGFNPLPHSIGIWDDHFTPAYNGSSNLPETRGKWYTIVIDVSHLDNTDQIDLYSVMFQAHGEDFDPDGTDPNNWGALVFMDNLRLRYAASLYATFPNPKDEATDVDRNADLSWYAGYDANSHDVYLGTSFAKVNDANTSSVGIYRGSQPLADVNYDPGALDPSQKYYWRIDEVNDPCVWKGDVWSFTTRNYYVLDDFESYNPNLEDTWKEGGKATVSLSTDPVHEGDQAMAIDYNNAASPYYSEAFADTNGPNSLDFGTDWTIDGVEGLSLWFRGYPDVRGSFDGNDPYTLVGDGWDIEETADGFHYAYLKLTGANPTWRVQARVDSIDNTDPWAKAGVMVRKTLEPGSIHATVVITPENGVLFQWRNTLDGDTDSNGITDPNIAAPYWVRVTRKLPSSGTAKITAEYSSNGSTWVQIGEPLDLELVGSSTSPIYLGLCVTSHTSSELCTAELSNVYMARNVTYLNPNGDDVGDPNADKDIGIPYNDPESMYVVLEDSDSNGIVYHPDPNAVQKGTWTHWGIELDEFSEDVDLTDVQKMYIGFGNRGNPTQDGAGTVYVDDIRLYARGCILSNRSADFAKADYAPEGNPAGDCMVDYREIDIMGRDWLKTPPPNSNVDLHVDNIIDFKDFATLAQFWLEEQMSLWP